MSVKAHRRDASNDSIASNDSLKKIHTFAIKTADNQKTAKNVLIKPTNKRTRAAKVYYVEEQVKILSEIIS
jgi:hypothetical protein